MAGPRVLIAWEIGAGFGHLAAMLPVIRELRDRGIEPVFSVPDPEFARRALGDEAPQLIPTVHRPDYKNLRLAPLSFADILLDAGFRDRDLLAAIVDRWHRVFDQERIDALLLDFAPFAQLAGWLRGLRMVSSSVPFTIPPVPLPAFPKASEATRPHTDGERALVDGVNHVLQRAGRASLDTVAPWLHAPTRFLVGVPQLNVYDFEPDGGYLGPIGEIAGAEEPDWPATERKRVLCYLKWSRQLPAFIGSLDHADRELACVVPNAPHDWIRSLPASRIRVFDQPVSLAPLLRTSNVVVSNASTIVASLAVLAGKPQLLLPLDQEKLMNAERLVKAGVGLMLESNHPAAQAAHCMSQLMDVPQYRNSAKALANCTAPVDLSAGVNGLVNAVVAERSGSI